MNDQIESLRTDMQKMKDNHARELNRINEQHQQAMSNLKRLLDKAYRWFPSFKRFLNMERECLQYGFNEEQTDKLLHGQALNYSGLLHSNEYRRNVLTDNVTAQVIMDEKRNLVPTYQRDTRYPMVQGTIRIGERAAEKNQNIRLSLSI